MAEKTYFLRKASGLVKTASTFDAFNYGLGCISIGNSFIYNFVFGPAFYPGADIVVATLIAAVFGSMLCLGYFFWGVTYPRSGGTYVYLSRTTHPALAVALNWSEIIAILVSPALAIVLMANAGFYPLFQILGAPALADFSITPVGMFLWGTLFVVVCAVSLIVGMKRFFIFQKIVFGISMIGTLILIGLLATTNSTTFIAKFNAFMQASAGQSAAYTNVINVATANGWASGPFSWGQTVHFSAWPGIALFFAVITVYIGGEIKNPKAGLSLGMVGSVLYSGLFIALLSYLSLLVFTSDFIGSVTYNYWTYHAEGTTAWPPFPTTFAYILLHDTPYAGIVVAILAISFITWGYYWTPVVVSQGSRAMIAWSLDRLGPKMLGDVSKRFFTPIPAIIINSVICIIWLAVQSFWAGYLLAALEADFIAWIVVMIIGIYFPFKKAFRDVYLSSPASVYRIGGLPLMSVVCALAAATATYILYIYVTDPLLAGLLTTSIIIIVSIMVGGAIYFFAMRAYRSKQGISIDQAFKELPVE